MACEKCLKISLIKESSFTEAGVDDLTIALKEIKRTVYREKVLGMTIEVVICREVGGYSSNNVTLLPMTLNILPCIIVIRKMTVIRETRYTAEENIVIAQRQHRQNEYTRTK